MKEKQLLKRIKPYKNASPMETIHKIRGILLKNDIFVIEAVQKREPITGVCSCRIVLGDDGLRELNIGTNGKGMNARYALASAYAEFMERFQNGALLWKVMGVSDSIPGDVEADKDEFRVVTANMITDLYGDFNDLDTIVDKYVNESNRYRIIELKDYQSSDCVKLPASLLNRMTGSNGMAAGNTRLEAIIQGLSEIFERLAIHTLFWNKITPPQIPEELFAGTDVYDRLKRLSSAGISYSILDCSIDQNLPVIGLLIEKGGNYHIHFGADPFPVTALERCLTEMFQGRNIDQLPLYPLMNEDAEAAQLFLNEERQYTDSTGQVPVWMVREKTDYTFEGFNHPVSVSDEEDMEYYLKILNDLGKRLFVHDCDLLGFPVVRLYVPGLTENHCPTPESCLAHVISADIRKGLCRLPLLSDDEFRELALLLCEWLYSEYHISCAKDAPSGNFAKLKFAFPAGVFAGRTWDDSLIIAAVYIRGGLKELGKEWLDLYIAEHEFNSQQTEALTIRLNSKSLAFLPTEWPQCPDCSSCRARHFCDEDSIERFRKENQLIFK